MNYKLYTLDGRFLKEVVTLDCPDDFTGIIGLHQGGKIWCSNGIRHRLDGPAIEWHNGRKEWYVDGKEVTEEQHNLLASIMKLKGLI